MALVSVRSIRVDILTEWETTGPNTAYKWYACGCKTLEDIKARKGGIVPTPVQEVSSCAVAILSILNYVAEDRD